MRVEPLLPDVSSSFDYAPSAALRSARDDGAGGFARVLDDIGNVFTSAESAEDRFASGAGSLQGAMYERARADVALSVATAAAQRATQALQSLLNLQV